MHYDQGVLLQETKGNLTFEKSVNIIHYHEQTKVNHIIISLDSKKVFNKSQHPLVLKVHTH